ncbi:MAG TPA: DMT family transporter [Burkholderiaceae bacterium]
MQSLWMLFASFVFAFMGVCVKLASDYYSISEIVMYRGFIGMVFLLVMTRIRGGSMATPLPWHHLRRGVAGVASLWLWFYAVSKLPLASAMTLNYMSPVWMASMLLIMGWMRGSKGSFTWGLGSAIVASFAGVLLLLQPSFQANLIGPILLGLLSGILSALAYLQVRQLGLMGEPEYRVVFYFSAMGFLAGFGGHALTEQFSWHAHSVKSASLLAAVGLCATIAQIAMTRAYRLGQPLVTANLQYSGIVFSSIWGIIVWQDLLGVTSWIGIAVILASGMVTTFYNYRNQVSVAAARAIPENASTNAAAQLQE